MNEIKIGIVGLGRMGITHYSIINTNKKVKITCIVDTSDLIIKLFKKYNDGISIYKNYLQMFEQENLDAIIVSTPPAMQYDIVKAAITRNIHVFVEKPYTANLEQAKELKMLSEDKKIVNQVGYTNRFNEIFNLVKKYVNENVIGDVIRFKSEMFSRTITKTDDKNTWRDSREGGGGVIFDMASHSIDLVNYIIGKPDKVIGTCFNKIYSKNVEDAVFTTFLYKNGCSGILNVNWSDTSYRKPINKIEIFGKKGKIVADQYCCKIFLNNSLEEKNLKEGWNTIYITDIFKSVPFYLRGNEFTSQLYDFVDCVEKGLISKCTFVDGLNVLEIAQSMFEDNEINGRA